MKIVPNLKRVYWEVTAGCNLRCIHCRRVDVAYKPSKEEVTTAEAKALIDELVVLGRPVLIFSGGEPLMREDLLDLISYAHSQGIKSALATNGTLVNKPLARALREAGIHYASISLDGVCAETHDQFRGVGNFTRAVRGYMQMKEAGIKVQINFTVTRRNVQEVEAMLKLAHEYKAEALYLFLLVPVGCGVEIADAEMLSKEEIESALRWVVEKNKMSAVPIKLICAPHFYRVEWEESGMELEESIDSTRKGCLAGTDICFISHKGEVFPCGYLPISSGNLRETPFKAIWEQSTFFEKLRNPDLLEGKCGRCSFKILCGGCRARAYYAYQDPLGEEPYCSYEPFKSLPESEVKGLAQASKEVSFGKGETLYLEGEEANRVWT